VKYVLVPRLRFLRPRYAIDPDGEVRTFESGRIVGDALLYDLEAGRHLGGFAVEVVNADQVVSHESAYEALQHDLMARTAASIRDRVAELAPGSIPPD
jgi:hypothetical protein